MDYPTPANAFEALQGSSDFAGGYCSRPADGLFDRALETQRTDQVRADIEWAALDRKLTDDAPWLNLYILLSTIVLSDRVGDYLSNPKYGPLYGHMWVVD